MDMSKAKYYLLAAIIALGAVLRFVNLGTESLSNDELSTWEIARFDNESDIMDFIADYDVHPPGHYFLTHYIINMAGDSEFSLRFLSALAGTLAILGMYLAGTRLYSPREGLIAAAFTAVFHFPLMYSQEVRPYSLLLFGAVFSTWLFLLMIEKVSRGEKIGLKLAAGYVFFALFCVETHYFGVLLTGLQGVWLIVLSLRQKGTRARVIAIYAVIIALYSPFIPLIWNHSNFGAIHIQRPDLLTPGRIVYNFFGYSAAIVAIAVLFIAFAVIRAFRKPAKNGNGIIHFIGKYRSDYVLMLWLFVPALITILKSFAGHPVVTPRNLIIILPAAYILLARGVTILPFRIEIRYSLAISIVFFILYHNIFGYKYYSEPHREQFREAMEVVAAHGEDPETTAIVGCAWRNAFYNLYLERFGSALRVDLNACSADDSSAVESYVRREHLEKLWYVAGHRIPDEALVKFLESRYRLLKEYDFVGVRLYRFGVAPEIKHANDSLQSAHL